MDRQMEQILYTINSLLKAHSHELPLFQISGGEFESFPTIYNMPIYFLNIGMLCTVESS